MKKQFRSLVVALGMSVVLAACGGGGDASPWMTVDASGASTIQTAALAASLSALPSEPLSAAEGDSLVFMREEEKLAHDVYAQFDLLWGASVRVFGNIAASEATHTEAVHQLLQRYALTDPAASTSAGVFQDATLQALYAQLLRVGAASPIDALEVGAAIEEIDMQDINRALLTIDNQDITLVYQNLLKGSRNHLRAFVSTLAVQGVNYVPQYMALADYQAIIDAPMER